MWPFSKKKEGKASSPDDQLEEAPEDSFGEKKALQGDIIESDLSTSLFPQESIQIKEEEPKTPPPHAEVFSAVKAPEHDVPFPEVKQPQLQRKPQPQPFVPKIKPLKPEPYYPPSQQQIRPQPISPAAAPQPKPQPRVIPKPAPPQQVQQPISPPQPVRQPPQQREIKMPQEHLEMPSSFDPLSGMKLVDEMEDLKSYKTPVKEEKPKPAEPEQKVSFDAAEFMHEIQEEEKEEEKKHPYAHDIPAPIHDKDAIYVRALKYQELQEGVIQIQADFKLADDTLFRLAELQKMKESHYAHWQETLDQLQERLNQTEAIIFKQR